MNIIPTILATTFADFKIAVHKIDGLFPYAHIDVMDGEFVPSRSFVDIEKINEIATTLQWELHLMVNHPILAIEAWAKVHGVFRALIHAEAKDNLAESLAAARKKGWHTGLVLNPETPISAAEPFLSGVDVLMCMAVHPGKNGAPFLPEVGEKIKTFTTRTNRPLCALDGGVKPDTIRLINSWGVDIANVGSALTWMPDVKKAHNDLRSKIKN